jgi:hypothetical protein
VATVICLTHGWFTDKKSGITFEERGVVLDGARVLLGVAEVTDAEDIARFRSHPSFLVTDAVTPGVLVVNTPTPDAPAAEEVTPSSDVVSDAEKAALEAAAAEAARVAAEKAEKDAARAAEKAAREAAKAAKEAADNK